MYKNIREGKMFVWSVKGNTLKFVGIICLAAVLMISLLIFVPKNSATASEMTIAENEINFDKVKSNGDRVDFLEQFGWEVDRTPEKECVVRIPANFDNIMSSYNDIQKSMGLDLEKYTGKEAVRYTYKVTNYPNYDGTVFANVTIYKNRVIAADVCSSDVDGFIRSLDFPGAAPAETEDETQVETQAETTADSASETTPES